MIRITCTLIFMSLFFSSTIFANLPNNRWKLNRDGSISWTVSNNLPHADHIEMSGDSISAILNYAVTGEKSFQLSRTLVWPMLRTVPNNTHASLTRILNDDLISKINVNGHLLKGMNVTEINMKGIMSVKSSGNGIELKQMLFPSAEHPAFYEEYQITNKTGQSVSVEIPRYLSRNTTDPLKGVKGSYWVKCESICDGVFNVLPDDSIAFGLIFSAQLPESNILHADIQQEKTNRNNLIKNWWGNLILETPDSILNQEFAFAKIRASESIYKTSGGYMHSPGGGSYYAAIWANDQAEYIGPFSPFPGYEKGINASLNAYLHFARFMNPEYHPIPSSIIAEGIDIWNGAGDRGDAAMIAYGAARFSLSLGDKQVAEKLWPLIEWCLEYNKRKLNAHGVVSSDTDELEGRFPSGNANLCTSSLYYDALRSACDLGNDLGKSVTQLKTYREEALKLRKSIDAFFSRTVEGFDTYRYYDGNDVLRSWICMPLTVGIYDRVQGTIDALFSPRLWTENGLATQAGDKTFWDRSTLYALRGVLQAGETEKAINFLHYYSERRLLGEHVPYPVEAYPEGNQRHLSAESGLYCRIYTEGLFGIHPTGLNSFELTPLLPKAWNQMALRKINAFGTQFDIELQRKKDRIEVKVVSGMKIITHKLIEDKESIKVAFQ